MRVFLVGVGCVGKTAVGRVLADLLDLKFFDLDHEIERFFGTSIERLQNRFLTVHSFRNEAAKALVHLLERRECCDAVIALPPSGLMGGYLRALKAVRGTTVVLEDTPQRILERITFFDIDSKPIEKHLTPEEKRLHLREIKKDITYFGRSYVKADLHVDVNGLDIEGAALKVAEALQDKAGAQRGAARA
jgi:shikimate kinase